MKLTPEQIAVITDAVQRSLLSEDWDEIQDKTLADLCAVNQDALMDDLAEDDPRDAAHRPGMIASVKTYDTLLNTSRADDILSSALCDYKPVEGDPSVRVCMRHDPELGLYGDELCPQDKSHG